MTRRRMGSLGKSAATIGRWVRTLPAGLLCFAAVSLCLGARLIPDTLSDRSIFVSVGERLLSGDTLYAGVYENHDPLFYYAVAVERLAGPIGEYGFELGVLAVSSACVYAIAVTLSVPRVVAIVTGYVATPLLLTGPFYYPGYTHLPGIALSLLACLMFMRERPLLAGLVIGVLAFTKSVMAPLPLVFCATYAALSRPPALTLRIVGRALIGLLSSMSMVSIVLAARGELLPFIVMQQQNVQYAGSALIDNSTFLRSVQTHLSTMFVIPVAGRTLALSTLGVAIAIAGAAYGRRLSAQWAAVFLSIIATACCSISILALTGIWDQHTQTMYFANALLLVVLGGWLLEGVRSQALRCAILIVVSGLLSGATDPRGYVSDPRLFFSRLTALRKPSDEALGLIAETGPTAYARIGTNDDDGNAFLLGEYKLACAEFHQYYFYDPGRLRRIWECASQAPFLIVADSIRKWDQAPDWLPPYANRELMTQTWNDYIDLTEKMLSEGFRCRQINPKGTRVCRKLDPAPPH